MTILSNSTRNVTGAFYERSRDQMTALRQRTETLQMQIGSESRLTKSSDDPVAASRLRNLARTDALSKIDAANAVRAETDLNLADATMSDITRTIAKAQELATQAATGTLSADQRAVIGKEMASIHATLLDLANAKDSSGNALFGGENTTQAYTLDAGGNAVYAGTPASGTLSLGEGQAVTRSVIGPQMLAFQIGGVDTDLLATVKTLADALQGGVADPAGAARNGLEALAAGLDSVTTAQTVVGTRLAWIDLVAERRTTMGEFRADEQKEVGGIDLASSVARLQEMMTVLEASQASFTRLSQLSLFNQL
jgi:flagellar hook-associated protein 3 FlgL